MQSAPKGLAVIAAAGAGKTHRVVSYVGKHARTRFAVLTFTVFNKRTIEDRFWQLWGGIPDSVRVRGWFSFLLEDLMRPYQRCMPWPVARVGGLHWVEGRSPARLGKENRAYWFDRSDRVYSDKIAELALRCDDWTGGAVFERVRHRYDHIVVDEVQDLAGYDLDVIERLLKRGVRVTMVGDPRQATFATNHSARHSGYRGAQIVSKMREWENVGLCRIEHDNHSKRCIAPLCQLADRVFPDYGTMASTSRVTSTHDGVFTVRPIDIEAYIERFSPQVLHNERCDDPLLQGLNFGLTKGAEFERVLIVPTRPISKWLRTGKIEAVKEGISRAKLYVAITRAKQSVAIIHDGRTSLDGLVQEWRP